jgi:hypothetical protein
MISDLAEKILLAILDDVGIPGLLQWMLARTPQAQAQAILDAEYAGTRAAVDAEAAAVLGEPSEPQP